MHGAQRSAAPHSPCGNASIRPFTCGTHVEIQRPSTPASDVQLFARNCPYVLMYSSGTQTCVVSPLHGPRRSAGTPLGSAFVGTQRETPQPAIAGQLGNESGGML